MSVTSRKTTSQSYKRESLIPYPSHQPSSGNIQDGMTSLSGTNSIPLAAGGTASVPSAANSISPHTTSYLSAGSALTAQGTHIPATAYHLPHGNASSSQPALALSSHSQGPTPASTPPTVPNETKGPGQYQNYSHTMNQHPLSYRGIAAPSGVIINNNAARAHNQPRVQPMPRYVNVNAINPTAHPMQYSIGMLPSTVIQSGNASAGLIPTQNYQLPGAGGNEHNVLFMPSTPYSAFYSSSAGNVRQAWTPAASARTNPPNLVVGQTNTVLPSSQPYLNMNSVASLPQQQSQQQHQPPSVSTKSRSKAVKIINPVTGEEVLPDSTETKETAKPDKKNGSSDARRVSESLSSNYSSSSTLPMTFAPKEQNQSVLNGTTAFVSSANDWKATPPQSGAASSLGQADATGISVVSSMKPTNVPTTIQSAKMDYKKPTREEQAGELQPDDAKLRDKQITSSWPETPGVQPTIAAASAQRGAPVVCAKKSSKEVESSVFNAGSIPPASISTAAPTILSSTVPNDGTNKSIVTTSNVVSLDDSEAGTKKTTKQGNQGGLVVASKDSMPSVKHLPGKANVMAAATATSSPSLPETTQTQMSSGGSSSAAQSNVSKLDSKSQASVPQQTIVQPATSTATISGAKPPTSALPTSGPVITEKATPTVSLSESLPGGSTTSQSNAEKTNPPLSSSKEEKSSPSTKPKNRGKDQSSDVSANEHSGSNTKGKTAQSVPTKHHGVEVSKPLTSTSSVSMAAKQTNGEVVEQNVTSEGKSKKKKGSNKKELNKKGQEKEGSDMDIFTKIEQSSPLPEKAARAEKVPQSNSQPLSVNTNTNNRSKINSSQKSENVSSVNSLDAKEKVINSQNIPIASTVPAQLTDTNKTESDESVLDNSKLEKKKYSVEYMLSLRYLAQCTMAVKVNYLPVTHPPQGGSGPRGMSQNGYAAGGNFLPNFMSQSGPSLAPRKSQQGSMRRDKPNQIHVSLSLREEVPLRRSKDAWKPAIFSNDPKNTNDEERKTEALFKTARGILNKLTPEKFPVLVEKFKCLEINTLVRLRGVIDLIFEKALDEPGFCKWYAEMCGVMQNVNVADDESEPSKPHSFRTVLLNKCQSHFESAKAEEMDAVSKRAEINACTDLEKKKELQLVYEEKERKARRKSVGNCRFIGELFKLKMLTPKIMLNCIRILISQLDEESLECLCKLLTTIGKDIDEKLPKDLDPHFKRLQEIADPRKTQKISSRIRFMILDVIDLRRNKWVPRRETDNPKTIDQMNVEMEKKEQEQKLANMTVRKSYDEYSRNKDSRKNRNDNQSEDNWKTVTNKNSNASKPSYKFDAQKMASLTATATMEPEESTSLGRPQFFNVWRTGSTFKQDKKSVTPTQIDSTRSSSVTSSRNASGGKLTPSTSLERTKQNLPPRDSDTNKMSRSGSVQNVHPASRESSTQRAPPSRNSSQTAPIPSPSISPLPDEQVKQFTGTIFKEFIVNQSTKDTILDFTDRFKTKEDKVRATEGLIEQVLEKPDHTTDCGKMVTALVEAKVLSVPLVVEAASTFLQMADDLKYDYPKFWEYMANLVSCWPLLYEDCKLFNELKTALQRLPNQQDCSIVLSRMEKTIRNDQGRIFEFLSGALDTEEYDNVFKWINENVDNPNCNPTLVTALTEAVCKTALDKKSKSEDIKEKYGRYFKKYIDNKETLELTCLHTIVDFSRRKEHPQGLLLAMFEGLYDSKALSIDSFMQLKNRPSEEIGVVMMNVRSFYEYLAEPDEQA